MTANPQSEAIWYVVGLAGAVALASIAALVHSSGYAPIGLVSLGVGVALGFSLAAAARFIGVRCRTRFVVGIAIITILLEHAFLYEEFRREWHAARLKSPEVALFRPEAPWSPAEYFAHEWTPGRAALWTVDAAIITATAVGAVIAFQRMRK